MLVQGRGIDGRGQPGTGEDGRGWVRTAGDGWGRRGTARMMYHDAI